jgi:hypothetical protein
MFAPNRPPPSPRWTLIREANRPSMGSIRGFGGRFSAGTAVGDSHRRSALNEYRSLAVGKGINVPSLPKNTPQHSYRNPGTKHSFIRGIVLCNQSKDPTA